MKPSKSNTPCCYTRKMSRDINPFGLRMPDLLRRQIEEACAASGRSMNAEIVYRLMKSFYGYFGGDPDTDEATLWTPCCIRQV